MSTPSYPQAQADFIKQTRAAIDRNPRYFDKHNWSNILPCGGTNSSLTGKSIDSDSFYVKPIAAWVPELLFENHIPCCPYCENARGVDPTRARWQNTPKILFGVSSHRYLDTKLYPCRTCDKTFTGYHPDSLKHDSNKYIGFFNIHLAGRFAVDAELYTFITSCYDLSTSKIHRILQQMAREKYINEQMHYYHAVRANKVKKLPTNVTGNDPRQATLDNVVNRGGQATRPPVERTLDGLNQRLQQAQFDLRTADMVYNNPLDFNKLVARKKQRNWRSLPLHGLGTKKLQDLAAVGITNCQLLVDFTGPSPIASFNGWKQKVADYYSDLKKKRDKCEEIINDLEDQIKALKRTVPFEIYVEE